jgi:hypothetical protein
MFNLEAQLKARIAILLRTTLADRCGSAPGLSKRFYMVVVIFTLIAIGMNFFGINPMKEFEHPSVRSTLTTWEE